MINVFQPSLGPEELAAVKRVFESNWVGKGQLTKQFENEFARYIGAPTQQVRSVSCCTEGLFQSMYLLGIGPGDEVVLPTISFVGAGNAIADAGARPVFCDVDPRTLNPSAKHIAAKLTSHTKAVLVLHYGGVPCPMAEIAEVLRDRSVGLIEDNACGVASTYQGRACGTLGDVGVWSFDAMKILVTGDGGMIYCKNAALAQQAEERLYLGLLTKSGLASHALSRWWEYEISGFGRRAIMNDVASAIGLEQLKKLPEFIAARQRVHEFYDQHLAGLNWLQCPPAIAKDCRSSYYFYWIQLQPEHRDALAVFLKERGVYSTFRYYPLHWVRRYDSKEPLPGAETAAHTTLCIPQHQALSKQHLETVVSAIHDFGKKM